MPIFLPVLLDMASVYSQLILPATGGHMYVDLSTNVPHYLTQFGQKVVKDAIGCHLLLDTHLHRSVQGCCCIQGLLWWRTRGNLLGCDYSLFYGIFPLPYCKVLLAKTSETIIIQTISVLFCVYDIGG